jgi:hypothetical protein
MSADDLILKRFDGWRESLFSILDAGRDDRLCKLLIARKEGCRCLYTGEEEEEFGEVAPYLVSHAADGDFLHKVLREGWGSRWGIHFTSELTFDELHAHFRNPCKVMLEGSPCPHFFRFYDPWWLPEYLQKFTQSQIEEVFGPVTVFYVETEDPGQVLAVRKVSGGVELETVDLRAPPD